MAGQSEHHTPRPQGLVQVPASNMSQAKPKLRANPQTLPQVKAVSVLGDCKCRAIDKHLDTQGKLYMRMQFAENRCKRISSYCCGMSPLDLAWPEIPLSLDNSMTEANTFLSCLS